MAAASYVIPASTLHHSGALAMLGAAVAAAEAMGQPQCIVVVDASGEVLGEIRMTGAKFLSRKSALAKARSAASSGKPSDALPEPVRAPLAAATGGAVTALKGGLPIVVNGALLGGIGVGSGTGDQDIQVANAALAAIGADVVPVESPS
eukprot:CAMPEP_0185719674 /NCGR_PEP_ID=MMETSP1164-20130828/49255_1 /TAXON_ID=1104430 /ORGANISM="Chrysoreinhardia sp, Strain CCMP2950" /LENGTH=148 /DNA_ID=CAMNT_0028387335 /DNA_START=36 /DNA_END=482 /DNA_ORIENTATION=-